ncbi:MAG: hypothetical protein H6838_16645 [Planctomycetes bacterium]|nr:hypothetical protein [Planctomycetota bacterium]MCB9887123.1 hypothetical protein [Planctomycetota bacterium]
MTVRLRGISPFPGPARGRAAGARARPWLLLAAAALPGLAGCLSDRSNTISRTARMREIEAERVVADRVQRELAILRQLTEDNRESIADAKAQSIATSSELRAVIAALNHQLDQLRAAEQDLEAAKKRAAAIEAELAPVRALEGQIAERDKRRQELAAQLAALEAQVAAAEQQLGARQAELQPKLQALQQQQAAMDKLAQAIAAAQAAAGAMAPAAPPVPEPAKK